MKILRSHLLTPDSPEDHAMPASTPTAPLLDGWHACHQSRNTYPEENHASSGKSANKYKTRGNAKYAKQRWKPSAPADVRKTTETKKRRQRKTRVRESQNCTPLAGSGNYCIQQLRTSLLDILHIAHTSISLLICSSPGVKDGSL